MRALVLAAASLLIAPVAFAQCRAVESRACTLTLHGEQGPSASESCTGEAWRPHLKFEQPERFSDSNADGWWETVLEIDLDPAKGCNCAVFRVHYFETPRRYSLNIGDSASNDGYGGDAGTDPKHSAEMEISQDVLSVFSVSNKPLKGQDSHLRLNLPDLAGHFIELEVCDQFLAFALDGDHDRPWAGYTRTLSGQRLFSIASPSRDEAGEKLTAMDSWIYAAFNRVIHERAGAPTERRTGSGVGVVELFLTP